MVSKLGMVGRALLLGGLAIAGATFIGAPVGGLLGAWNYSLGQITLAGAAGAGVGVWVGEMLIEKAIPGLRK